jgi:hypothetical protein
MVIREWTVWSWSLSPSFSISAWAERASERSGWDARRSEEQEGEHVGVEAEPEAEHAEEQAKGGARARGGKEAERDIV